MTNDLSLWQKDIPEKDGLYWFYGWVSPMMRAYNKPWKTVVLVENGRIYFHGREESFYKIYTKLFDGLFYQVPIELPDTEGLVI